MGQCYSVELKLKYKDKQKAFESLLNYLIESKFSYFNRDDIKEMDDAIEFLLTNNVANTDDGVYYSAFDASYGWESVMQEGFESMIPYLKYGSKIVIYPDEGHSYLGIKNGKPNYRYY